MDKSHPDYCFTIDALNASGSTAWRLLQDQQSWRTCTYAETLTDDDACITKPQEAEAWILRRMEKHPELGLQAKQKAGMFDFLMRGIFSHAVLHRLSSAPIPQKEQMRGCIDTLKPGTPWLLFLNISGHFCALDTSKEKIIGNLNIAVRGEIASSENYIGPKAAANEAMMGELYTQFLGGWLEHLTTSNMGIFVPDREKLKEQTDYLEAIQNWQHQ